jgi:ribose-phosphate pyrophosphokinase
VKRIPAEAKDIIYCEKVRDVTTGYLVLKVLNPELAEGRNCIVVDDICDGGRTFVEIAKQLPPVTKLVLAVTHGIFSKGLRELLQYYNEIVTTNSLYPHAEDVIESNDKLIILNIY